MRRLCFHLRHPSFLWLERRLLLFFLAGASVNASADDSGAQQEKRFLSNARQLVFEGKRSGEAYFSPDGRKLIFQSEREADNPFYQQYILDLEPRKLEGQLIV